nr:transcription repressor OFP8-like [Lolium perenne]
MNGTGGGGRRFKDRLAWLLRPANSFLRSSCSSSSSNSISTFTAISTSSATTTATATAPVQPFSSALGLLQRPQPEESTKTHQKKRACSSSRHCHARRRQFKNADDEVTRKLSTNPFGFTTTDDDNEDTDGDTETFLSSRSLLSSDSSGFYYTSSNLLPKDWGGRDHHRQRPQQAKRRRRRRRKRAASCVQSSSCGVRDQVRAGFRPVVMEEEELRKGLAVVRRSSDPYGDFRESMVEMIVERQVFGTSELEQLLHTYLSLNPARLHPVILQAFSDIWVVLRGC